MIGIIMNSEAIKLKYFRKYFNKERLYQQDWPVPRIVLQQATIFKLYALLGSRKANALVVLTYLYQSCVKYFMNRFDPRYVLSAI